MLQYHVVTVLAFLFGLLSYRLYVFAFVMAFFKRPSIPPKCKFPESFRNPKLGVFDHGKAMKIKKLGEGSFGSATLFRYEGNEVVIKELHCEEWDQTGRKFLKEASIMSSLECKHVVSFKAISYDPMAIMTDYSCFSFRPFNDQCNVTVHSLDKYLSFLNTFNAIHFEQMMLKITQDVLSGLTYLHGHQIAHRDLKPANILVCNRHYANLSGRSMAVALEEEPIICRLTDFGEARSLLHQSKTLLSTKTVTVGKGSIGYMAPEILPGKRLLQSAGQLDLLRADIWSFGMVLYSVLNPDSTPFDKEARSSPLFNPRRADEFVGNLYNSNKMPSFSSHYHNQQVKNWTQIILAYSFCTNFNPEERPCLTSKKNILQQVLRPFSSKVIQLDVSQSSVQEKYDRKVAHDQRLMEIALNDGTNSCVFLCYKIASCLFSLQKEMNIEVKGKSLVEDVILQYPAIINQARDETRHYDLHEAKKVIEAIDKRAEVLELEESQFLQDFKGVFTTEGMHSLFQAIERLSMEEFSCSVYMCAFYSFLIVKAQGKLFLVDTHPVQPTSGGKGTGVIVLQKSAMYGDVVALCDWVWKRLYTSGVKSEELQTLTVLRKRLVDSNQFTVITE